MVLVACCSTSELMNNASCDFQQLQDCLIQNDTVNEILNMINLNMFNPGKFLAITNVHLHLDN